MLSFVCRALKHRIILLSVLHTRVGLIKIIIYGVMMLKRQPQRYLIINEKTRRHAHLHARVSYEHVVCSETKSLQRNGYDQANPIKYPKMRRLI